MNIIELIKNDSTYDLISDCWSYKVYDSVETDAICKILNIKLNKNQQNIEKSRLIMKYDYKHKEVGHLYLDYYTQQHGWRAKNIQKSLPLYKAIHNNNKQIIRDLILSELI